MTDNYYTIVCPPAIAGVDGALVTFVWLSGEFDLVACDDLRAAVLGAVRAGGGTRIVIDLAEVDFVDSETVRVLLEGYAEAQRQGLDYRLARPRGVVQRVLDVIGQIDVMPLGELDHVTVMTSTPGRALSAVARRPPRDKFGHRWET